ncbi:hypothetical protein CXU01_01770 [Akkermansia muciniphila]|nr:hypothetical protein CXU01_01770 [Akkermansia muciniphila]
MLPFKVCGMENSAYCCASRFFFSRFCQERKAHMARAQTQTIARTMYEWQLEGMEEGNCPAL